MDKFRLVVLPKIEAFQKASEFLDYLRPSRDHWWDKRTGRKTHVFRGHADATWKLLPSGWRPLGRNNRLTPLHTAMVELWDKLDRPRRTGVASEDTATACTIWRFTLVEAAYQFAALGRRVGLEVPWSVPTSIMNPDALRYFVPPMPLDLLALAQHHGIPTKLLDWTEDPLTAAYFALGGDQEQGELCVWALRAYRTIYEGNPALTLSPTSNVGNHFLRAQSGLFLTATEAHDNSDLFRADLFGHGDWLPFEEVAAIGVNLTKITLPHFQRPYLRELLLREGRSEVHLKPSWDSAANEVVRRWEDLPDRIGQPDLFA